MSQTATDAMVIPDRGYKVLDAGLLINRELTREEWCDIGHRLTQVHTRTTWAIGDWLVYGEGRGEYGSSYVLAAEITGRRFHSLSQAARVSRAFPIAQRSIAVPWSFYREALALISDSERQRCLMVAAKNRWTRDDLADYLKGRPTAPLETETHIDAVKRVRSERWTSWARKRNHHAKMKCPKCGHEFEPKRGRLVEKSA